MKKPNIVFDFDGVIHSYSSGWKGIDTIPDPPVKGIREAIRKLRKDYFVIVVSSRCESPKGLTAVINYLNDNNIEVDNVTSGKPPAVVYIDDRGLKFDGNTENLIENIKNFKTWLDK